MFSFKLKKNNNRLELKVLILFIIIFNYIKFFNNQLIFYTEKINFKISKGKNFNLKKFKSNIMSQTMLNPYYNI